MDFTPEEREYIDWKLKLCEETQHKMGIYYILLMKLKKDF